MKQTKMNKLLIITLLNIYSFCYACYQDMSPQALKQICPNGIKSIKKTSSINGDNYDIQCIER